MLIRGPNSYIYLFYFYYYYFKILLEDGSLKFFLFGNRVVIDACLPSFVHKDAHSWYSCLLLSFIQPPCSVDSNCL